LSLHTHTQLVGNQRLALQPNALYFVISETDLALVSVPRSNLREELVQTDLKTALHRKEASVNGDTRIRRLVTLVVESCLVTYR
jgi:hypothetical protein